MSDIDFQEKKKQFLILINQMKTLSRVDPYQSWHFFCEAQILFPQATHLKSWKRYLEELIELFEDYHHLHGEEPPRTDLREEYIRFSHELQRVSLVLENTADVSEEVPQIRVQDIEPDHEQLSIPKDSAIPHSTLLSDSLNEEEQEQIKQWLAQAKEYEKEGKIPYARDFYDKTLHLLRERNAPKAILITVIKRRLKFMKSADLFFEMGCIHYEQGEAEEANQCFDSALTVDPYNIPTLEYKLDIAKYSKNQNQVMKMLQSLSNAYENQNNFQQFDQIQKTIKNFKNKQ